MEFLDGAGIGRRGGSTASAAEHGRGLRVNPGHGNRGIYHAIAEVRSVEGTAGCNRHPTLRHR